MTADMLASTGEVRGQTPEYRATPLVNLGFPFPPHPDLLGTLRLNNKGQVVYGYRTGGTTHAWGWLPECDYGLSAGFHDISALSASSQDATAIARDINECPSDTNSDGCVDVDDYIAVVLQWGACPIGSFCNGKIGTVLHFCKPLFCAQSWVRALILDRSRIDHRARGAMIVAVTWAA